MQLWSIQESNLTFKVKFVKRSVTQKRKIVRGDSFPDSDQRQIQESIQTTRIVGHGYQHGRVSDGVGNENRSEAQNENSFVVPINSDPVDDTKGKERCDKDCKIM